MWKVVTLIGLLSVAVSGHVLQKRQVEQPAYSPVQPTLAPTSAQLLNYQRNYQQQLEQQAYNPLQPTLTPTNAQLLNYQRNYGPRYSSQYTSQNAAPSARIVAYNNEFFPPSSYRYAYETDNGISAHETGEARGTVVAGLNEADTGAVVAQGGYQYVSPEGVPVNIQYVADENGYHPSGIIIPGNTNNLYNRLQ